jgi:UDP-sugar pyrophosphorylase
MNYGVKWCIFFQDTNSLAFNSMAASLGVSALSMLEVNTLTCPRIAKSAMGAIVKLRNVDGKRSVTVNVEYNQLDPLLRANSYSGGDTNGFNGFSPYPGNTNQLIFRMEPYCANLLATKGIMGEFVNPKYTDASKTNFKKPCRLECMMQDYPKILDSNAKVGFSTVPSWLAYSPCKNNVDDAAIAVKSNIPPSCAFSSESDHYNYVCKILRLHKVNIGQSKPQTFQGISAPIGPRIVIDPSTAIFPCEIQDCFPSPGNTFIIIIIIN